MFFPSLKSRRHTQIKSICESILVITPSPGQDFDPDPLRIVIGYGSVLKPSMHVMGILLHGVLITVCLRSPLNIVSCCITMDKTS